MTEVFIGNVDSFIAISDLQKVLEEAGPLASGPDWQSPHAVRCAYKDPAAAELAVRTLNGRDVGARPIRVSLDTRKRRLEEAAASERVIKKKPRRLHHRKWLRPMAKNEFEIVQFQTYDQEKFDAIGRHLRSLDDDSLLCSALDALTDVDDPEEARKHPFVQTLGSLYDPADWCWDKEITSGFFEMY
jgi:hypothetical protein